MALSVPDFVERWKYVNLSERAAAQSHFLDLCELLDHPKPVESDRTGDTFTFEKHVSTNVGGKGFADVWKRGYFGWEYKAKDSDLNAAYHQLLRYREDLENPPLLVTCDQDRFEVHTNFTGTRPLVYSFTLSDLIANKTNPNCALPPIEVLRAAFEDPEALSPKAARARVTETVAAEFSKLAKSLQGRGVAPEKAARYLMRIIFCLFADSIGLLPDHLFKQMIEVSKSYPQGFVRKLSSLFRAMAEAGSMFGVHDLKHFNGGLFTLDDTEAFPLDWADMAVLSIAAKLDWAQVEPAIFGTLFERGLDPRKRSQLGQHYTSAEDIALIVEPVVMAPLEARWAEVKAHALEIHAAMQKATDRTHARLRDDLQQCLLEWMAELSAIRILDPACGSGNFLYVALRRMLDLWQEARVFASEHGLATFVPKEVRPSQLFGIETNIYAHELASVVVWIGYLQWLHDHGMGVPREPVLEKLDNIQHRDAILAHDTNGKPVEAEWPKADFIIGNPPFLGDKKMRGELGDKYVDELRALYEGRVPGGADFVTFWFERARTEIEAGRAKRAGLLATNSIRMVGNRPILERILQSGGIFMAWSDREWVLDGAAVRVSMIGFDGGLQQERTLDGQIVSAIHADLTAGTNAASATTLKENENLCFLGVMKGGPFDLSEEQARSMLSVPLNPNQRPNSDVIKRRLMARDIVQRNSGGWLIDFGDLNQHEAALYERPFEYVKRVVKPVRGEKRDKYMSEHWWLHGRSRPALRRALSSIERYIVTPEVAKHRVFAWMNIDVVPDHSCHIIARADDYMFGILQSKAHELWSLQVGSTLEDRPRYTATACFETFPFPWPPGKEPKRSPLVKAISLAAKELVEKRDAWLNPPDAHPDELKKRTLTNLYNTRPAWLADAHRKLDQAVFAAYGWPSTLTDAELLERLLMLNRERAEKQ